MASDRGMERHCRWQNQTDQKLRGKPGVTRRVARHVLAGDIEIDHADHPTRFSMRKAFSMAENQSGIMSYEYEKVTTSNWTSDGCQVVASASIASTCVPVVLEETLAGNIQERRSQIDHVCSPQLRDAIMDELEVGTGPAPPRSTQIPC